MENVIRKGFTLVAITAALSLSSCATTTVAIPDQKPEAYLSTVYDIKNLNGFLSQKDFIADLALVSGTTPEAVSDFNGQSAIEMAVKAAGFEELTRTYSAEKVQSRLAYYGLKGSSPYVACALDAGLVTPAVAKTLASSAEIPGKAASVLLMNVADSLGAGRYELGYSNDADIQAKLTNAYNSMRVFSDPQLDKTGALIVQNKITTGFSIKQTAKNAHFIPSLTLKYGHDNLIHMKQLVALLSSEGIVVRLQLEPKVSIYQYDLSWGPIPEPSPTYYIQKYSDDLYLVHAVEYDLVMEFSSLDDLKRFDSIVETYAKKNDDNQKEGSTVKLIKSAWWQPLYRASFEPDAENYKLIYNCRIANNGYEIQSFVLPEKKDAMVTKLESMMDLPVKVESCYVNNAFYRYLTGEDHQ